MLGDGSEVDKTAESGTITLDGDLPQDEFDVEMQDSDDSSSTDDKPAKTTQDMDDYARARSKMSSSMQPPSSREMTAVAHAKVMSRVRQGDHWPVHLGFKNISYTVNVPKADVGISNVVNTMYMPFMCSKDSRIDLPILRNISGAFEAGRSTLVLGPPGCGVTTLFKALSQRLKTGSKAQLEGEIYYSGYTSDEVRVRSLSTYVDQNDEHTAVLTVRETLQFAYDCFGGPEAAAKISAAASLAQNATPEEIEHVRKEFDEFPQFIIDNLLLGNAADTIVGNDLLRGVSGGERKRVTSAEMMMARRPLAFYDQISTGLDSSATFDICRRITGVARVMETTPIVALLQPPPEVYDLFDEIMILAMGYVVYHGPRENVLPYFSSIGFDCPDDRDIADFIQEVTTEARTIYQTRPNAPSSEEALAKAWLASPYSKEKTQQIEQRATSSNKVDSEVRRELFAADTPIYSTSCCEDFQLVLKRQWQLVSRDPAFLKARAMQAIIMGVIIGTLFLDLGSDLPESFADGNNTLVTQRYGLIFSALLQCALAGMAQVPIVLDQRPVYYKQSSSYFFRTINYVLAESITVIPIIVFEAIILSTLIFWLSRVVPWGDDTPTGESDVGGRFMLFVVVMICINLSFSAWLRTVATLSPSAPIGQVIAGVSISACILFSGFIITQDTMPPWFIWIYWITPISWAYRSAVLVIFQSKAFTAGQQAYALGLFSFTDDSNYLWAGILMLIGFMVVDTILSTWGYEKVRFENSGSRQTKSSPNAEETNNPDVAEVERLMSGLSSRNLANERNASSKLGSNIRGESYAVRIDTTLNSERFVPVDLVFRDLWYAVQGPEDKKGEFNLNLLKGVSGYAESGTLTALMGSSGAGKSTLLDVLALRKTSGKITGDVLVNGRPQEKITFSRIVGYVEQNDIHSPTATVAEAILFSALLRQPKDVPRDEKEKFVENVIDTLQLNPIRDFMIGHKTEGGLSTEQAKRVTIGVELAANPAIIFADEPTSGLDASSARVVMDCLERIARANRTVICTIHQPSKDIFTKFDRLLLLRRGGEMVYFGDLGEKSKTLLDYLAAIPGTPGMPNPRYNPATYMLEAIGKNAGKSSVDYHEQYKESDIRKATDARIEEIVQNNLSERPEIHFKERFASDFKTQADQLFLRWMRAYWRNPSYNTTRIFIAVFVSLFFGFSFFKNGDELSVASDVQSFVGLMFMASVFMGVIAVNTAIPTIMAERAPFYRERAASYYSVAPMVIAITCVELPYIIFSACIFVPVFYFIVKLWINVTAFWTWWGTYVLLQTALTFLGHLFSTIAPNEQVATVFGALCFGIWSITAGLMIAVRDIPPQWYWLSTINPLRYSLNALVSAELACDDPSTTNSPGCNQLTDVDLTAWGYTQETFGFEAHDWKFCIGALAGFAAGWRIVTILAYTYVSFLKR